MTIHSITSNHYDSNSEIDMRAEMNQFLYGGDGEPIRGQLGLIWKADITRRLSNFKREANHYPESKPQPDYLESGFMHTELEKNIWIGFTGGQQTASPDGRINPATTFIYCEHDIFASIRIAELSEIWSLILDSDGNPIKEDGVYKKDIRWNIRQAYPLREQGARIEYWRFHCERQDF